MSACWRTGAPELLPPDTNTLANMTQSVFVMLRDSNEDHCGVGLQMTRKNCLWFYHRQSDVSLLRAHSDGELLTTFKSAGCLGVLTGTFEGMHISFGFALLAVLAVRAHTVVYASICLFDHRVHVDAVILNSKSRWTGKSMGSL